MSGNPSEIAALVADLRSQLAAAKAAQSEVEAERDRLRHANTDLSRQLDDARRVPPPAQTNAALDTARAEVDRLRAQVADLSDRIGRQPSPDAALQARIVELEALCLADPPAGSGIVKVQRYMTSDGRKHKLLPDAQHHAAKLGIMADLGLDERTAEGLIARKDRLAAHLAMLADPTAAAAGG